MAVVSDAASNYARRRWRSFHETILRRHPTKRDALVLDQFLAAEKDKQRQPTAPTGGMRRAFAELMLSWEC